MMELLCSPRPHLPNSQSLSTVACVGGHVVAQSGLRLGFAPLLAQVAHPGPYLLQPALAVQVLLLTEGHGPLEK